MKLNHDCVRELLLYIEENIPMGVAIILTEEMVPGYQEGSVLYCAAKLIEANYVVGSRKQNITGFGIVTIAELTWEGHTFLDNIRSETSFTKAKNRVLETVGNASIQIIAEVASQVTVAALGLNK